MEMLQQKLVLNDLWPVIELENRIVFQGKHTTETDTRNLF